MIIMREDAVDAQSPRRLFRLISRGLVSQCVGRARETLA